MAISQRLDLRQTQSLVMTPQLQQAIKLLQLSNIELIQYVDAELEQNPLLEREETMAERDAAAAPPEPGGDGDGIEGELPPGERDAVDYTATDTLPAANEAPLDTDYDAAPNAEDGTDLGALEAGLHSFQNGSSKSGSFDDLGDLDTGFARQLTLREHLLEQLGLEPLSPMDRLIAVHLIDMVDDNGYLTGDLLALSELLSCPAEVIEAVLCCLQRFDPAGVFARSLGECLGLQLRDRNRLDPCMQALLDNLPRLAARDLSGLRRICGVDEDDLAEMIQEIRNLNPRPGNLFDAEPAQPITPDIFMRLQADGGWLVELNSDALPRVLVNSRYYARISRSGLKRDEKDYLSERLQSANWLVKSLHQRANTILRVATEIVRQQDGFFHRGVQALRPLILRDIAEAIGMHESTISRVTTNKYIATPRGIYELKYFFTSSIASANGGVAHSAEAVRFRIKGLIDQEHLTDVLSDDKIVELLVADGIDIARRTVAKYREAMRIPSSVQRRRDKMIRL
jgi:RNA polymerase sigma-54 factor